RSEVQDARDPGGDQAVTHRLGRARRHRDHADRDAVRRHDRLKLADMPDDHVAQLASDQRLVAVENRLDAEPPGEKSAVVRQGTAEVTGADDYHGPALRQPQGPGDLIHQILHVVAYAPDAVRSQVAQVLAEFGRVDAGRPGEFVARDGGHAAFRERVKGPQVDGQPSHRGLGDTAGIWPFCGIAWLGFLV